MDAILSDAFGHNTPRTSWFKQLEGSWQTQQLSTRNSLLATDLGRAWLISLLPELIDQLHGTRYYRAIVLSFADEFSAV